MFFPPQPQLRLADFYCAAEMVLVPSRTESFGLVALEAQACGTPVVGAATGGLRYVVEDGVTGFLVKGWDPADYAERMLELIGDEPSARRLGPRVVRLQPLERLRRRGPEAGERFRTAGCGRP